MTSARRLADRFDADIRQGQWKLILGVGPHGKAKEKVKDIPSNHAPGKLYYMRAEQSVE